MTNKSHFVILFSCMFEGLPKSGIQTWLRIGGSMILDLSAFYTNWNASGEKEVHLDMDAVESKMGRSEERRVGKECG